MRLAVSADHAGFELKRQVVPWLESLGHEVLDLGAHVLDPDDDYPDFARYVSQALQHGQAQRAVLICGSGIGASVAATKHTGVRAAVCHDAYSAHQGVEHDDLNVLCMGARVVGVALAEELVKAFVGAAVTGEERHQRRLEKVKAIEQAQQEERR